MRVWKTVLLTLLAVVIASTGYGITLVRRGFSARGTPSFLEALAATTARSLSLPSTYRQLHNPLAASPDDGSGDTLFGKGLYPKPPDMRKGGTQNKGDGELYYIIENGVRLSGMPAFGEHAGTEDAETWRLVIFIRHLPQITTGELHAMNKLNPKTEADRAEEQQEEEFLNGNEAHGTSVEVQHHH